MFIYASKFAVTNHGVEENVVAMISSSVICSDIASMGAFFSWKFVACLHPWLEKCSFYVVKQYHSMF